MATVRFFGTARDGEGNVIKSATVIIYESGTTTAATIYEDAEDVDTWTASNTTVTADDTGSDAPDGTSTADLILATAGNGTALQVFTSAENDRVFGIWLKRKTGTGNIQLTLDGGSTWTTKTITTTWTRYDINQADVTNPSCGVRIVTNADAIWAWGGELLDQISASTLTTSTAGLWECYVNDGDYASGSLFKVKTSKTTYITVTDDKVGVPGL